MSPPNSVINAVYSLLVLVPFVALLVLDPLNWELSLTQAFRATGMPRLSTRRPTASGFAKVCAEYPLCHLHLS